MKAKRKPRSNRVVSNDGLALAAVAILGPLYWAFGIWAFASSHHLIAVLWLVLSALLIAVDTFSKANDANEPHS